MTQPNTVEAIRERRAKITPGECTSSPQEGQPKHCLQAQVWGPDGFTLAAIEPTQNPKQATALAEFYAAAPTDIDYLLSENEKLNVAVETLKVSLREMSEQCIKASEDAADARRAALLEAAEKARELLEEGLVAGDVSPADARHIARSASDYIADKLRALAQQQGEGITKEWCLNAAKREAENGDSEVGAGFVARDPEPPPDEAPP